jgi:hypothetical protein
MRLIPHAFSCLEAPIALEAAAEDDAGADCAGCKVAAGNERGAARSVRAAVTPVAAGKWYYEVQIKGLPTGGGDAAFGWAKVRTFVVVITAALR